MLDKSTQLKIKIEPASGAEIDEKELDRLTRQMRRELEQLDVDSVSLASEGQRPPEGEKAVQFAALGQLLVVLSQAGGVLPTLITLLQSMFVRDDCDIRIKIGEDELVLTHAPDDVAKRALDAWLDRHHTG